MMPKVWKPILHCIFTTTNEPPDFGCDLYPKVGTLQKHVVIKQMNRCLDSRHNKKWHFSFYARSRGRDTKLLPEQCAALTQWLEQMGEQGQAFKQFNGQADMSNPCNAHTCIYIYIYMFVWRYLYNVCLPVWATLSNAACASLELPSNEAYLCHQVEPIPARRRSPNTHIYIYIYIYIYRTYTCR